MSTKLLIRDLTLRDGQQSAFATRMNQNQVDRVLDYYKDAGFYAMDIAKEMYLNTTIASLSAYK